MTCKREGERKNIAYGSGVRRDKGGVYMYSIKERIREERVENMTGRR